MLHVTPRKQIARWLGWFFLINTLFSLAIQLGYLHLLPNIHLVYGATPLRIVFAWAFLIASYITQSLIVNFVLCAILLAVSALVPRYRFIAFLAVVITALLNLAQILDVVSFQLFHTHNMDIVLDVFRANALTEVLPVSATEVGLIIFLLVALLMLMSLVAWLIWRRIRLNRQGRWGRPLFWVLLLIAVFSYVVMACIVLLPPSSRLSAENSRLLLKMVRFVPYYNELYTFIVPGSEDDVRHVETADGLIQMQTRELDAPLAYPRVPMQCRLPKSRMNIVFIVLDTWRYDAFTARVTPNIYRFAQKSLRFDNYWSGGNCTQPGIFSLFYALPANYWRAMEMQKVPPVFMDQLKDMGYQIKVLGSATLRFPAFDRTVFSSVSHLITRTPGDTSVERDKVITDHFQQFLSKRNTKKPFFGFLFYDTAHNYCGGGSHANQQPFQPAIGQCKRFSLTKDTDPLPYINRYHNGLHYIDQQVRRVLHDLEQRHLLKNTVVVITADHGEEFDDEKLNYWSHASAYTSYQLHVPLIISWPGKRAKMQDYFTTSYDVVPTLMQQVLGCRNAMSSYSIGQSLFTRDKRSLLIAGSYGDYAIVTPHRIVRIYPGGDFVINYRNGHQMPHARLNASIMRQAYDELRRFFE